MCGCENCITIRMLQASLNAFRVRQIKRLENEARDELDPAVKAINQQQYDTYKEMVQPEGRTWHDNPRRAVLEILCPVVDGLGHHKLRCVLGHCVACPSFPVPDVESDQSENAPMINFHTYVYTTKCSKHGILTLRAKMCEACEALEDGEKKGKITTRKQLTLYSKRIGEFIEDYYLPALEKYAYHMLFVKILSKNEGECGNLRKLWFMSKPGVLHMVRDYAERLLAEFNFEIQTEHFGNGHDLDLFFNQECWGSNVGFGRKSTHT